MNSKASWIIGTLLLLVLIGGISQITVQANESKIGVKNGQNISGETESKEKRQFQSQNQFVKYSDSDSLPDSIEQEIGTNSTNPDTDSDGIPDGFEYRSTIFEKSDPLHKDLYIEIDWMEGNKPNSIYFKEIKMVFEQSPVSNPDGKNGITIHLLYDDSVKSQSLISSDFYYNNVYSKQFNQRGRGFRHMFFVEKIQLEDKTSVSGVYRRESNSMLVGSSQYDWQIEMTIMHELGHSVGLSDNDYNGIDSREKSLEEYPSVMNYNYKRIYGLSYSDNKSFNDWEHIERSIGKTVLRNEITDRAAVPVFPCNSYSFRGCVSFFSYVFKY
jgi:hypothetical protein